MSEGLFDPVGFQPPHPEIVRLARGEAERLLDGYPRNRYLSAGTMRESVVLLQRGPDWVNVTVRDRHPIVDPKNTTASYVYKRVHFGSTGVTARMDSERHDLSEIDGFRYIQPQYVANEKRSPATESDVREVLEAMVPLRRKDELDPWGRTLGERRTEERDLGVMESTIATLALLVRRRGIERPVFTTPDHFKRIRLGLYTDTTVGADIFAPGQTFGRRFRDFVLLSTRFTNGFRVEVDHPLVQEEEGLVKRIDIYNVENIKDSSGSVERGRTLTLQRRTARGPRRGIKTTPRRHAVNALGTLALDERDIDPRHIEVVVSSPGRKELKDLLGKLDATMLYNDPPRRQK